MTSKSTLRDLAETIAAPLLNSPKHSDEDHTKLVDRIVDMFTLANTKRVPRDAVGGIVDATVAPFAAAMTAADLALLKDRLTRAFAGFTASDIN